MCEGCWREGQCPGQKKITEFAATVSDPAPVLGRRSLPRPYVSGPVERAFLRICEGFFSLLVPKASRWTTSEAFPMPVPTR